MRILGLDISSVSTGHSVLDDGKLLKRFSGKIKIDNKFSLGKRLDIFDKKINNLIIKVKPDIIIIEDIYLRNTTTFKILSYFHGVAYKHIYSLIGKNPFFIGATKVRNLLGVKGKEGTFNYINDLFNLGYNFEEHNDITDSIAVCLAYQKVIADGKKEKVKRGTETKAQKKKTKKKVKRKTTGAKRGKKIKKTKKKN